MEPAIKKSSGIFFLSCGVCVNIRAGAGQIWNILIHAENYPRWNSTISRIEGRIADGERLKLHVPGAPRVFTPKISGLVPKAHMTWSDGVPLLFRGERVFGLRPQGDGTTDFSMVERFSGLVLPLVKNALPDFGPIFARFAADLKAEAERVAV